MLSALVGPPPPTNLARVFHFAGLLLGEPHRFSLRSLSALISFCLPRSDATLDCYSFLGGTNSFYPNGISVTSTIEHEFGRCTRKRTTAMASSGEVGEEPDREKDTHYRSREREGAATASI